MPSEIDVATNQVPLDRRTRKRLERRDHLLDVASDLVADGGVSGVTFAALAERSDYAPASLYTYFPSHSALLAALQQRALERLAAVAVHHVASWDDALHLDDSAAFTGSPHDALARLWAFSELFCSAPERFPRDFSLQQEMLVHPSLETVDDARGVVPAAMRVLDVPRRLLADARVARAVDAADPPTNAIGEMVDLDLTRTLGWVVALNGALLTDALTTGLTVTGRQLGAEITATFLRGWGASVDDVERARRAALSLPFPTDTPPEGARS